MESGSPVSGGWCGVPGGTNPLPGAKVLFCQPAEGPGTVPLLLSEMAALEGSKAQPVLTIERTLTLSRAFNSS